MENWEFAAYDMIDNGLVSAEHTIDFLRMIEEYRFSYSDFSSDVLEAEENHLAF